MGQTDLLEDLVGFVQDGNPNLGMSERGGDNDEIEIGSDYPYAADIAGVGNPKMGLNKDIAMYGQAGVRIG